MPEELATKPAPRKTRWWVWLIFFFIVGLISWDLFDARTYQLYLAKPRLSRVISTIDPVKTAIANVLQKKEKLPLLTTVITAANQGKPATPDWAALGFTTLPGLAPEVASLRVSAGGEIVVVMTRIGEGMDGTELRAKPVQEANGISWTHQCTSSVDLLKRVLRC